jgi:hypothetical protein
MTPDIIGNVVVQYCIMWWNKLYKMYTTIYDSLSCQLCHCSGHLSIVLVVLVNSV